MELDEIRREIDEIDYHILNLLRRRMILSIKAGRAKKIIEDKEREAHIFQKMNDRSDLLLRSEFLEGLYRSIIAESKRLQGEEPILAAFHGERGTYAEVACRKFDAGIVPVPCKDLAEVFEGVANGEFDMGVVPIESSFDGVIATVIQLLTEGDLSIVGEVTLHTTYSLLSHRNISLEDVKIVYSDPQVLGQCRHFIARNGFESRPLYDSAAAAMMIALEKPAAAAAIASVACSGIYELKVLKDGVEDSERSYTRFIVLSKGILRAGGDKCSITFSAASWSDSLAEILRVFSDEGIEAKLIGQIPSDHSGAESKFLLDFRGHLSDEKVQRALRKIKVRVGHFRLLGCYRGW
ncbi:MAG: bifunctional chorismate mutase/prephenate dehydratase [Thermoplasmata archaeon]